MEKLLIIAEKPSQAKNYATALGGVSGTFEGDEYVIVALRGHILAHETPEKVAYPNHAQTVGSFNNIDNLPWSHTWFDFDKKVIPPNKRDFARSVIADIKSYTEQGYVPVIACDIDAMGEGDLLASEVLVYIGYKGKVYREYHTDETPKPFVKAMREKKDVTNRNEGLIAGTTRMTMDFLTQQLVRVATVTIQEQGYRLPRPVPVGRLQSTIMNLVGSQIEALEAFTPSSVWESRYNLDDILVLSNPDMTQFKTKEEWDAEGLPLESAVRETKQVPGRTAPPKALSLSGLAKLLSPKGISPKKTIELTQKMYDEGVISYPRTEDKFITPEQFNEMLPMVDDIVRLLGMAPEVFTHREPRNTHVKTGGSHGALRPGSNMPDSLDALDIKFGQGAQIVYKLIADRFLMMFLEDTEWVRHEYETTDTGSKVFKGSIRIITKKGVVDPDEDASDVATTLPNLNNKAKLYPHEIKAVKPKKPSQAWLLDQLEKHNVGTAATQVNTVSQLVGKDNNYPLCAGAKLTDSLGLSPIGTVSYKVAKNISLGTPECTRGYEEKIKSVVKGEVMPDTLYETFTEAIRDDVNTIRNMHFDLSALGFPPIVKKVEGVWNGTKISVSESSAGYTFTPEELSTLFSGGCVTFMGKDFDGNPVETTVKLGYSVYKGKQFVGYHDVKYFYGLWNGEEIRFKRSHKDYNFTDDDCNVLINGGSITFNATDKDGKLAEVSGKLERQPKPGGGTYVGINAIWPPKEDEIETTFEGETVRFKRKWSSHTFTDEELEKLLRGETITFEYTTSKGKQSTANGKLDWKMYQGNPRFGFQPDFGK